MRTGPNRKTETHDKCCGKMTNCKDRTGDRNKGKGKGGTLGGAKNIAKKWGQLVMRRTRVSGAQHKVRNRAKGNVATCRGS